MAIEKMILVSIEGEIQKINKTLMKCSKSGCFHIIPSIHDVPADFEQVYKASSYRTMKNRNLYSAVLKQGKELGRKMEMNIAPSNVDYKGVKFTLSVDFKRYFQNLENSYRDLTEEYEKIRIQKENYKTALLHLEKLKSADFNFEKIFAMKYISVRFGRLPIENVSKLSFYNDENFYYYPYYTEQTVISSSGKKLKGTGYVWCVYFTPYPRRHETDKIFEQLFFERIRLPDLHGTASEAKTEIEILYKDICKKADAIKQQITDFKKANEADFSSIMTKLKNLSDSYEIRKHVAISDGHFFLSGYIPKRDFSHFKNIFCNSIDVKTHSPPSDVKTLKEKINFKDFNNLKFTDEEGVNAHILPRDFGQPEPPPVRLRNNFLTKPFELLVKMYGLPQYDTIDPTPVVAFVYMILYGLMFGDVGQGLVLAFAGLFMTIRKVKFPLAKIMTRVGFSGAFFGIFYGSVFGNEHIITPIFHQEAVYKFLGFSEMPENIFALASYILIATLAIGILIILLVMILNMICCSKSHNFENGVLGPSGLCGFVLYSSIISFIILSITGVFNPPIWLIILTMGLPCILIFFKHPISKFVKKAIDESRNKKIETNEDLASEMRLGKLSESKYGPLSKAFKNNTIRAQYGNIGYENFLKIKEIKDRNFIFVPIRIKESRIYGLYIAPSDEFVLIDKTMELLGFVKSGDKISKKETEKEKVNPIMWLFENFIEMYEVIFGYFTNTISFLRVGGFIMSHAGLMLVVNVLSERFGEGNFLIQTLILVFGNIFVMCLEGFLVGIQTLRLTFYEMFSRFYNPGGSPFTPVTADISDFADSNK